MSELCETCDSEKCLTCLFGRNIDENDDCTCQNNDIDHSAITNQCSNCEFHIYEPFFSNDLSALEL